MAPDAECQSRLDHVLLRVKPAPGAGGDVDVSGGNPAKGREARSGPAGGH
jgi:hypothetical protein